MTGSNNLISRWGGKSLLVILSQCSQLIDFKLNWSQGETLKSSKLTSNSEGQSRLELRGVLAALNASKLAWKAAESPIR